MESSYYDTSINAYVETSHSGSNIDVFGNIDTIYDFIKLFNNIRWELVSDVNTNERYFIFYIEINKYYKLKIICGSNTDTISVIEINKSTCKDNNFIKKEYCSNSNYSFIEFMNKEFGI